MSSQYDEPKWSRKSSPSLKQPLSAPAKRQDQRNTPKRENKETVVRLNILSLSSQSLILLPHYQELISSSESSSEDNSSDSEDEKVALASGKKKARTKGNKKEKPKQTLYSLPKDSFVELGEEKTPSTTGKGNQWWRKRWFIGKSFSFISRMICSL